MAAQVITLRVGEAPTGILAEMSDGRLELEDQLHLRLRRISAVCFGLSCNPDLENYVQQSFEAIDDMIKDCVTLLTAELNVEEAGAPKRKAKAAGRSAV